MEVFIAEFRYGKPFMVAVTVTRETEKSYMVDSSTKRNILDNSYFYGKRVPKNGDGVFLTESDAFRWLSKRATAHLVGLQKQEAKARTTARYLEEIVEVLDESNNRN